MRCVSRFCTHKLCWIATSERAVTQTRHVLRSRSRCRPVEAAVFLGDRHGVDAGLAPAHQTMLVEFPLLVAIGTVPLPARIVPFILKPHRDAIVVKRPEILDQAVIELFFPLALE